MRTRGDKRPSRKNDRKVLMADESTKSWADTDSDSTSSSSSSSDSEQEEVHCLMADQSSEDEVFDFANIEFTREDLIDALNDMVKEYKKLSHSFEEIKAENKSCQPLLKSAAYSKFIYQSEMASSLFVNTVHVCFESLLAMDNAGMVAMFESLVDTGLKGIQLAVGPQPLWFRNRNSGLAHRIMVRVSSNMPHDPLGITDSACKNQLIVVSVQYGPFNPYIPIRSTTIGKSRVAIDLIAMHTSWRSNSDIASVTSIGYPRMSASGESSTTMHRLLHASGSHPIPTPYDPNEPLSMSGKKKEMTIEFRLLCDILAKTKSVKAGSFDAITQEKFLMMAAITCGVRINWNRLLFNILKDMVTRGQGKPKVLTEKTVHRYIVLNDKVGMEVVTAEPRVKKTPTKKAASTKRPATDAAVAPMDAVPLQMIAPTPAAPAEQPPVPK
ncbi:hypothetical protein F511_29008 [Dorcoceras hygrometricum]|uniref:Uncharacterized protein n=1 Tax=Dorcoceras hygrometricum TaxID=472368 RepID=A0A2Z7A4Q9_9LAMI|nr:hypothetical protein F511_29008 [Dorcoceras hygrometricum]